MSGIKWLGLRRNLGCGIAGIVRNFSSILFYKIINALTNNMFPENASDFRLMDKQGFDVFDQAAKLL